jgi:hypothetical protein
MKETYPGLSIAWIEQNDTPDAMAKFSTVCVGGTAIRKLRRQLWAVKLHLVPVANYRP